MKLSNMDEDLAKISDPETMGRRLSYWETRWQLTRGRTAEQNSEFNAIAKRHAERVSRVLGAG